ncbi:hypothetical protein LWI29_028373 [Acer saccharum]|uniref:RNase H type-1 domain-containing protein n=1 Tax=Acer saccharum TaxID=4024 RepID=A0AA39VK63_ACESA|nr:hypothetical protein LWI29_028373 [Acer saccharum]
MSERIEPHTESHLDSVCGSILSDIIVLCSELTEFSFSYVPRKGNQVAHILAKNALLLEEDRFWLEEYLCCAAEEVLVDSFG